MEILRLADVTAMARQLAEVVVGQGDEPPVAQRASHHLGLLEIGLGPGIVSLDKSGEPDRRQPPGEEPLEVRQPTLLHHWFYHRPGAGGIPPAYAEPGQDRHSENRPE